MANFEICPAFFFLLPEIPLLQTLSWTKPSVGSKDETKRRDETQALMAAMEGEDREERHVEQLEQRRRLLGAAGFRLPCSGKAGSRRLPLEKPVSSNSQVTIPRVIYTGTLLE